MVASFHQKGRRGEDNKKALATLALNYRKPHCKSFSLIGVAL
ncbi:MAG: hypothetical protein RBT70_09175 [Alphaproteobacteria bacterium]|jgi:hypothetical protein|nr:hypothetical protein [Alphaproteobacteria bacterium]